MGRRAKGKRRAKAKKHAASLQEVDVAELPMGVLVRQGRFISFQPTMTPEEHATFVRSFTEEQLKGLGERRGELVTRLADLLEGADLPELLACASLSYLRFDPDTYRDSENDQSPAHIEFLALQSLAHDHVSESPLRPGEVLHAASEAIDISRELFQVTSMMLTWESICQRGEGGDHQFADYVLRTKLHSLSIRGAAYPEHLVSVLHGCFDPVDAECRRVLGFTVSDALRLIEGATKLVNERMEERARHAELVHDELSRRLKRLRSGKQGTGLPDDLRALKPTEAKARIDFLVTQQMFEKSADVALFTAEELRAQSGVALDATTAFLEAFTCPPSAYDQRHHVLPGGAHPLTERPFLKFNAHQYMLPVPTSMIEAIRPRMEDLLAQRDQRTWNRYLRLRGKWANEEAARRLASALPGSLAATDLPWRSASDESDLDGLVSVDDLTLRIQTKAGRLHASTRRGSAVRMQRNIDELIKEAHRQHAALATALDDEGARAIGLGKYETALAAPLQFEVIVCLDDVTVWSTETHVLGEVGAIDSTRPTPWILSLTDLMAVTDLLQGSQLVHYLLRRQRLEAHAKVSAHDELDWVGHYIAEGLYFDQQLGGPKAPSQIRLTSYTGDIDAWYLTRQGLRTKSAPKPAQPIPPKLRALVQRLERERPRHWVVACVALLEGDDCSRQEWEKRLSHISSRLQSVGWSNASQSFTEGFGVSYFADYRLQHPAMLIAAARAYAERKSQQLGLPNWVMVAGGGFPELLVVVHETGRGPRLSELLRQPGPIQTAALDPAERLKRDEPQEGNA